MTVATIPTTGTGPIEVSSTTIWITTAADTKRRSQTTASTPDRIRTHIAATSVVTTPS